MAEWIRRTRDDGTVEYLNPNHDELYALAEAAKIEAAQYNDEIVISPEEIAASDLAALRNLRDQKLAETDWSQGADVPDALKTKYTTYRQALRDITKSYISYEDVVWPDKPS